MKLKHFAATVILSTFSFIALAEVQATIETSVGNITLTLYQDKAPATVANFIEYAESGFYDNTVFHRVIPDFMVHGGGFTPDMGRKDTRTAIQNESDNGLANLRGTVAMARTQEPHSATSQFFINHSNNLFLDFSANQWGYAVFGEVSKGMDIVDRISVVKTTTKGPYRDIPVEPVIIKTITVSGSAK